MTLSFHSLSPLKATTVKLSISNLAEILSASDLCNELQVWCGWRGDIDDLGLYVGFRSRRVVIGVDDDVLPVEPHNQWRSLYLWYKCLMNPEY